MLSTNAFPICILADQSPDNDIGPPLEQAGYPVTYSPFSLENGTEFHRHGLIVIEGNGDSRQTFHLCRQIRNRLSDKYVPILMVHGDPKPAARLASLESGADTYLLRPFDPAELMAQVKNFARLKDRHDRLAEKTEEVHRINKRLQTAYQQIDRELELASRIQVSFLPQSLPQLPQVRFAVHYKPCGRVGGDFYDVFRLDEKHFGFYVADAMGHGVPASLLTIYVKKGIRAKEISGHSYRLVPPKEVLQRLNRDLIEQNLSDQPFITMAYLLMNSTTGTLQMARSGHPYPLYIPHDGKPELWKVEGTLLGVFDTSYQQRERQLRPGDKILLYTDGIDGAAFKENTKGVPSLMACAEENHQKPIDDLVKTVAEELLDKEKPGDDSTLLGLEMVDSNK